MAKRELSADCADFLSLLGVSLAIMVRDYPRIARKRGYPQITQITQIFGSAEREPVDQGRCHGYCQAAGKPATWTI
jgi:hypothetical protein